MVEVVGVGRSLHAQHFAGVRQNARSQIPTARAKEPGLQQQQLYRLCWKNEDRFGPVCILVYPCFQILPVCKLPVLSLKSEIGANVDSLGAQTTMQT